MHKTSLLHKVLALAVGVTVLAFGGWASADPPSRAARLGYLSGAVSFSPAGEDDWVQATINRPLTTGDRLWADPGARTEIQIGGAMVRMNGGTSVSVLNLDDQIAQLQLTQGALNVRVRHLEPNQIFEVDTPNVAFTLRQPGEYRIEVDPDGVATTIVVRKGQGEVYGDDAAFVIDSRQSYRFMGTGLREYRQAATPRFDGFDRWSSDRDRRYDTFGFRPLRIAGRGRLSGPRCKRHVARRRGLRQRLVPESSGHRLGAVSRRPLGMGRPLGLDLGGRRALGLRRVALRPLDESARNMGLGTRPCANPRLLRPGTRRVCRRRQLSAIHFHRHRRWSRMVPARAARGLSTSLSGEPPLFREHQPQQHRHQQYGHQQHLQQHQRDQCRLREPASPGRRGRGAGDHVRAVTARVQVSGARVRGHDGQGAGVGRSTPGPD